MKTGRLSPVRMSYIGIMIALYFVLAKLTIPIGNLHITLASLPIVILAVVLGPIDASIAALLGEFMIQALGQYGLTPTTPLWCLPPVLRALTVGLGCRFISKRYKRDSKVYYIAFFAFLMLGAVLTTLGNTAVTYIDAKIYHYYSYAYVFGQLVIRLITGIITAALVGAVTLPVANALHRQFGSRLNLKKNPK